MQSCAVKDVVIVSDHQGLISSSNSERQSGFHELKVLYPFGSEIDMVDLYELEQKALAITKLFKAVDMASDGDRSLAVDAMGTAIYRMMCDNN